MVFSHVYFAVQELGAESGDGVDDLVDVVCDGQEEILVLSFVHKMLHESVDRHLVHPEVDSQEDHRTCIAETKIVDLYGVLEDLLHGAGAARGVYDAAFRNCEDEILSGAVVEVLCDVCCEWGSGLMAI